MQTVSCRLYCTLSKQDFPLSFSKCPHLLTGASGAVKGSVTVFCIDVSGQGKVFTAVFADTEALFPLHAFPHKKVDDIINVLRTSVKVFLSITSKLMGWGWN